MMTKFEMKAGAAVFAAMLLFLLLAAWPAAAQTVAIGTVTSEIDLNRAGGVTAKVARTASPDTLGAVDKFLHGAVRLVQGQGDAGPKVAIDWHSLSSEPGGGDAVQLAPPMASEIAPNGTKIAGGQEMPVAGDAAALIRAARTIAETRAAAEAPAEDNEDADEPNVTAADDGVTTGGAGAPLETDEAQLPTIQGVTATETVETVVATDAYGETTEGCKPELSEDETYVTIMKAPTTNGVKDGDCAESLETASVQETYIGCGYDTTSSETTAYAKKRRYYVYGGSTTDIDTECVADEERSFAIFETPDGCQVFPDLEAGVARQHTARVFVGRENERVTVDGCAAREGGTEYPIEFELCSYRDDFPNKVTYETHIAKYQGPDGLKRNIGNCTDTGITYAHFEDTSVCEPLLDLTNNKLFEQYRIRIDLPNGISYRTPSCKPFAAALTNLQETQAGCETFHQDYAGYSLGGKRIIRQDNQAQVRGCQVADLRYDHVYVPEGWVYDDANLQAFPKDATYIDLPQPAGRTLVAAGVVRDQAAPVAYSFARAYSENGGTEYVEDSCDKYIKQNKMEEWRRPDDSIFKVQNGFNAPLGPTNGCVLTVSTSWPRKEPAPTTHYRVQDNLCGVYPHADGEEPNPRPSFYASAEYIGTKTLTRGDGVVFTFNGTMGRSNCSKYCQQGAGSINAGNKCPTSMTDPATINSWRNTLGWW